MSKSFFIRCLWKLSKPLLLSQKGGTLKEAAEEGATFGKIQDFPKQKQRSKNLKEHCLDGTTICSAVCFTSPLKILFANGLNVTAEIFFLMKNKADLISNFLQLQ